VQHHRGYSKEGSVRAKAKGSKTGNRGRPNGQWGNSRRRVRGELLSVRGAQKHGGGSLKQEEGVSGILGSRGD